MGIDRGPEGVGWQVRRIEDAAAANSASVDQERTPVRRQPGPGGVGTVAGTCPATGLSHEGSCKTGACNHAVCKHAIVIT